jgi:hypothetical protein
LGLERFSRLERLADEPSEEVVYDKPREDRLAEFSEEQHEQVVEALHEFPEEIGSDMTRPRGPFRWRVTTFLRDSISSAVNVTCDD